MHRREPLPDDPPPGRGTVLLRELLKRARANRRGARSDAPPAEVTAESLSTFREIRSGWNGPEL